MKPKVFHTSVTTRVPRNSSTSPRKKAGSKPSATITWFTMPSLGDSRSTVMPPNTIQEMK